MYQKLIIVGNLGKDPESRFTPSGKQVVSFSVAVSSGYGENKKTDWFRVSAWDKTAEACNNYLKKGSRVLVEGTLQSDDNGNPRTFQRQDGSTGASFELRADSVKFMSSAERTEGATSAPADYYGF